MIGELKLLASVTLMLMVAVVVLVAFRVAPRRAWMGKRK